ncbi:hypothetical protein KJY40_14085 [Pseudomonas fitomaticsae]|uniref:Uncharacterized protein n=1 Tax=Pseudomonas fitomaticsae TaxID=2837969 RepID=A0ABY3Q9G7_9PSED|nr:hypothetical protein KJY40_14085 [Pseudomonas fitomaticsae]
MDIDENAPGNRSQQAVTRTTDNETGHDPRKDESPVPLSSDDEAPVEQDMSDVAANNSVSAEHPQDGSSLADNGAGPQSPDKDDEDREARGLPASDPESGA